MRERKRSAVAFGRVLRETRIRKGLSIDAIAQHAGVSTRRITGMEQGQREPNLVMLFRLASALGVGPSELVARVDRLAKKRKPKNRQ
jgi:transcriptional regulator with XRE-family HTH domain